MHKSAEYKRERKAVGSVSTLIDFVYRHASLIFLVVCLSISPVVWGGLCDECTCGSRSIVCDRPQPWSLFSRNLFARKALKVTLNDCSIDDAIADILFPDAHSIDNKCTQEMPPRVQPALMAPKHTTRPATEQNVLSCEQNDWFVGVGSAIGGGIGGFVLRCCMPLFYQAYACCLSGAGNSGEYEVTPSDDGRRRSRSRHRTEEEQESPMRESPANLISFSPSAPEPLGAKPVKLDFD